MTKLLHLRNSTSGLAPAADNLTQGQLAINTADSTVWTLNSSGVVKKVGDATFLSKTYIQTINGNAPTTAGDVWVTTKRNKLINGRFRVNQRGFPAAGAVATFVADRWYAFSNGATFSQGTSTTGPDLWYLVWAETAGTSTPYIQQSVNDVSTLSGGEVTISFYANPSKSMTLTPSITQNFGTSGSTAVTTSGTAITMTSGTWTRYTQNITLPSISGKTIGTNNYMKVQLSCAASPGTFTLNLTEIQLENGPNFMGYEFEDIAETTQRCLFYYESIASVYIYSGQLSNTAVPSMFAPYAYKRVNNPTLAYANVSVTNMATGNPTLLTQSYQGARLQLTAGNQLLGGMGTYTFDMTVNAELPVT
jgi:hypothetical protein